MDDFRDVYEKYFNNIWHICLAYMKNTSEAEDALQETFLRYIKYCKKKRNAFFQVRMKNRGTKKYVHGFLLRQVMYVKTS